MSEPAVGGDCKNYDLNMPSSGHHNENHMITIKGLGVLQWLQSTEAGFQCKLERYNINDFHS